MGCGMLLREFSRSKENCFLQSTEDQEAGLACAEVRNLGARVRRTEGNQSARPLNGIGGNSYFTVMSRMAVTFRPAELRASKVRWYVPGASASG
jgi:hypothetical protein